MRYRRVLTAMLVVAIAAALTVPAFGQMSNDRNGQATRTPMGSQPTETLFRADKLIGQTIVDRSGEQIGEIEEILVDGAQKNPSFLVITAGEVTDDDRLIVVPWRAFEFSSDEEDVVFSHNPQTLLTAPGFTKAQWPDITMSGWEQNVNSYWQKAGVDTSFKAQAEIRRTNGIRAEGSVGPDMRSSAFWNRNKDQQKNGATGTNGKMPKEVSTQQFHKASELTGMNVNSADGSRLANIEGLVLDGREGKVVYCLVSYGGFLGIGQNTAVVPFGAIQIDPNQNVAMLNADRRTLDATQVRSDDLSLLMDDRYAQRVHSVYDTEPYWSQFGYIGEEEMLQRQTQLNRQRDLEYRNGVSGQNGISRNGKRGVYGSNGTADETTIPRTNGMNGKNGTIKFDPDKSQTIEGTVTSVGTITVQNETGLRLRVEGDDQLAYVVYAGPRDFVQQQGMRFRPGDEVTIKCSIQTIQGEQICVAQEIQTEQDTLTLFDEQGRPQFKAEGMNGTTGSNGMRSSNGYRSNGATGSNGTRWSNGYRLNGARGSNGTYEDEYGYYGTTNRRYQPRIPDEEYSTSAPRSRQYEDEYGYYGTEEDQWGRPRSRQTRPTDRFSTRRQPARQQLHIRNSEDLIGMTVKNFQREELGRIDDIAIDVREGRIAYAIVTFGGRLGRFGGDKAAVPWSAIQVDPRTQTIYLDADEQTLRDAKIEDEDIERLGDPQFGREIHRAFGEQPYWEAYGYDSSEDMMQQRRPMRDRMMSDRESSREYRR